MEQTNAEEVKIAAYSGEASLQSGGWLRLLLPELASDLAQGDCASELGLLCGKAARKIAAPLARTKTDLILCTELPKRELPESECE
jgi:hypothetical protein